MYTPIPIYSWGDAYVALHRQARASRGTTTIHADNAQWERWPETTGADVIAIAAFVHPFVDSLPRSGNHGTLRRWAQCLADLERRALPALRKTYRGNREFWRGLASVIVAMSSSDVPLPSPDSWDPLLDLLGAELRNANLPAIPFGPFPNAKKIDEIYMAQWQHLKDSRGVEKLAPEPGVSGATTPVPRATNADVIAMADFWTAMLQRTQPARGNEETHKLIKARWEAALADVAKIRAADPAAVYDKRYSFFRVLDAMAPHIAATTELPTDWDRMVTAVGNAINNLPENLGRAAEAVAGGLSSAASKVAGGVGSGLFSGLKVPLLVGGGLLGAFLLLRRPAAR
jgi:hypothetical protein